LPRIARVTERRAHRSETRTTRPPRSRHARRRTVPSRAWKT